MHRPNNFAFIDGVNLHLTYVNLDWELDYAKLRNYLRKKYDVTIAYYFLGKTEDNSDLYDKLESYGYNLKYKTPSQYTTEEEDCPYCHKVIAPELIRNKSDCDSFMTLEVISSLSIYDRAVIITSDGDFDELVKELLLKDKLKLVFAPCREGCSGLLKSAAKGRIAFIDDCRDELEKTDEPEKT
jgi:uncharacterized LabA/DUF88 family protein